MPLNPYINFNGNCREAVEFYADIFQTEKPKFMTFGDMPEDPNWIMPEQAKNLIMHTNLNICGNTVMFSDVFPGTPYKEGNNISLAVVINDKERIQSIYNKLSQSGTVEMELQKTDWSPCYGSVIDKFGISWQLNQQE